MKNFTVTLTSAGIAILLTLSLLLSVGAAVAFADIPPNEIAPGNEPQTVISGLRPLQGGGDVLIVYVRGFSLPHPIVVSQPGAPNLELQWDNARFPKNADKRDWWDDYEWSVMSIKANVRQDWWREFSLPLLQRVTASPVGDSGVKLKFTSNKPLVLDRINGVEGADELELIFKTYTPPKAKPPVVKPAAPANDPMQIKTPVTMEFRDASVKDVFRMLAQVKNLNLFLDASVPDTPVTLSFKEVPFNEAMGYIMRMTGLTYALNGKTLVIGTPDNLGKTMGRETVKGYTLAYAIGEDGKLNESIAATLTGLVSLSKPPVLDTRTRTMYVTATPAQHIEIEQIIRQIDRPGRQVMLRAQIVEVTDGAQQEFETMVSAVYDRWLASFTSATGLNTGYYYSNPPLEPLETNYPVAGTNPTRPLLENITLQSGTKLLSAGISALETDGKAKVLANPSIIAIDGHKASVKLTHNYKYPSGTDSNGNTTYSDEEVGPTLDFTPAIGRDRMLTLNIKISTGTIVRFRAAGNGAEVPETTSRSVETVVRVRDTEPFVVGGLFEETKNKERRRIPVIGYIPLLGDLFTYRKDNHSRSEVAMIVIPFILDIPDEDGLEQRDLPVSSLMY